MAKTPKHNHLLPYAQRPDFRVGRATELTGRDRRLYRFLEIMPGAVSWLSLIGMVLASIYAPFFAAYFIIAFAVYWVLKTAFLSYHLRYNWKRLRDHMAVDWQKMIERFEYGHLYHLVVLPFYNESEAILNASLKALSEVRYDTKAMIVVLAREERAGDEAHDRAERMKEKWASQFGGFHVSAHPADIEGEVAGKGSNATWAAERNE